MISRLRQRILNADPLVIDTMTAVGLALFASLQIWSFSFFGKPNGPMPPGVAGIRFDRPEPGAASYALAVLCFLPLALRRKIPWLALLLSGSFALVYALTPRAPVAFTTLAPMIALYTLAAEAKQRRPGAIALIVIAMVIAVPLIAISGNTHWLRETVSTIVLLSAAALLGDSARSRRDYVEQVEQRAIQAELTREEDARRRVDEERLRIAREVHDVLAHSLSIVTVQAAAAESLVDREPARAKESIGHIRSTSKQALSELRSMLSVLRAPEGEVPLAPAATIAQVERLVAPVREAGFQVTLTTTGDLEAVPAFAAVSGYRIVQESLTNAVRHAKAAHIDVRVTFDGATLTIEITDDGNGAPGFDPHSVPGHGIRGMSERVDALEGEFSAGPREGGGFGVTASIPIRRTS